MSEEFYQARPNDGYHFIKDYKQDDRQRASFCLLAEKTFGIQFEEWYQQGFWNENYISYSLLWQNEVVSNVSLNKMKLMIDGEMRRAIQIGTVMTAPAHRRLGLALSLMKRVISDYEDQCDLFFLAANKEAVPLYENCGFKPHYEQKCVVALEKLAKEDAAHGLGNHEHENGYLKRVQMPPEKLLTLKKSSAPLSTILSATDDEHILMFYYLLLRDHFYQWQPDSDNEIYMALTFEDNQVDILDVYHGKPLQTCDWEQFLLTMKHQGIKRVSFNFTPDIVINGMKKSPDAEGDWMVLDHKGIQFPADAWFPRISRA